MGFRGVLLRMAESDVAEKSSSSSSGAFCIVAPDAELTLPAPRIENELTTSAINVFVVTDHVSNQLLQIAGSAAVLLQQETCSALWLADTACVAFPLPALTSAAPASNPSDDSKQPTGSNSRRHCCFCFQFRSSIEYELFARTAQAQKRAQQLTLLENSVLYELELELERQQKLQQRLALAANGSKDVPPHHHEPTPAAPIARTSRMQGSATVKSRTQGSASSSRSVQRSRPPTASTSATPIDTRLDACVLCGAHASARVALSKHPFVLQDARGAQCYTCLVCMQHVLAQHVAAQKRGAPDSVCGLCGDAPRTLKPCARAQCTRVYCPPCLEKLVGKAQVHKVLRQKRWHCPNCIEIAPADAADTTPTPNSAAVSTHVPHKTNGTTTSGAMRNSDDVTKRKRKRQVGTSLLATHCDSQMSHSPPRVPPSKRSTTSRPTRPGSKPRASNGTLPLDDAMRPLAVATTTTTNEPVDYVAKYFAFLIERESAAAPPADATEDVCFCCKDGGDVIECDWPAKNSTDVRCPKVYHEDCLGYQVPETFDWKCPRHRCQACGIVALYSCRFCVTSFCKEHKPKGIETLGAATPDIPDVTYVVCSTCDAHAQRALDAKTLSAATYAKLLHPPTTWRT